MLKTSNVIRGVNLLNNFTFFLGEKAKYKTRSFSIISLMMMESEGNSRLEPYHYFPRTSTSLSLPLANVSEKQVKKNQSSFSETTHKHMK